MKYKKPGKKKSHGKTKEDSEHLSWVASQGCMICGKQANVHHIRLHGEPKDHFRTIPLCWDHHQGPNGIHDGLGKKAWREKFGHELDMLKILMERKDEKNMLDNLEPF